MRIIKDQSSDFFRRYVIALACAILVIFTTIITWVVEVERHTRMSTSELAEIRAKLEGVLSASTYPVEGVANVVLMRKGGLDGVEIQTFLEGMHSLTPALLSIQLAPDAIVGFSSRPERDAKAIGHDLLADKARRTEVIRSIQERRTVLVGPFELIQGGTALIARKPIFIEGWKSPTGIKDFYGLATAIIDATFIFKNAEMDEKRFALLGHHALGQAGEVIYGATKIFDRETLNMPIHMPDGLWTLATPKPGLYDFLPELIFSILISIVISLIVMLLATKIRQRQEEASRYAEKLRVASELGDLGFIEQTNNGSLLMSIGAKRILEAECLDALMPHVQDSIRSLVNGLNREDQSNDIQEVLSFNSSIYGKKTIELSRQLAKSSFNIISVRDISNVSKKIEHEINLSKMASIGELTAGVAHELNTPLQYITDNLIFLRTIVSRLFVNETSNGTYYITGETARDLSDEFPSAIDDCIDGTDRMTRIIAAMKSYAAPEDGLPSQSLDITKVIQTAVLLTAGTHKHLATVSFEQAHEPYYVIGRENELTQVFINLINNSCDAFRYRNAEQKSEQKAEIEIVCEEIDDRLKITFKDNAGGIPENIRRKIFDLFFTTKPIGEGTGQGLAISLAILKRLAGDMRYQPAPPDGSMFIVELPLAEVMMATASDVSVSE